MTDLSKLALDNLPADHGAWALAYAAAGIDVFPCKADKTPLTLHGLKDATRDPKILKDWWNRWPFAEPAWELPPTVVVADLDVKRGKNGFRDFERLDGCNPRDIVTPMASTPSGGLQLFYDAAGKAYQNRVAIDETAIDTRTAGGYVVLPASGNGRVWLKKLCDTPLQAAPQWLDVALKQDRPPVTLFSRLSRSSSSLAPGRDIGLKLLKRSCALILAAEQGTQEETRHRECFLIGTLIAAGAVDSDVAYRALTAAAKAMPAYGKPWRDLNDKVKASIKRGMEAGE
jgi:putative DNA primase/helicase